MTEISKHKPAILIIDDDEQIRRLLKQLLMAAYDCTTADSAGAALAVLDEADFSVVISDINMPGMTGLEFVPALLQKNPGAVAIMISGQQTIDYAIEAMRAGAFDYLLFCEHLLTTGCLKRNAVTKIISRNWSGIALPRSSTWPTTIV